LQQGFNQAAAARQQDITNRGALAQQQLGLGTFQQGATGTDIQRLGSLGALNQAQAQAQLDAQREAARQATFLPQEQLDRFAGQVTGIMGGYPGQFQSTIAPNPTPLQTALGLGTTLAGIYGATRPGANLTVGFPGSST
jgi:multidrug efflux pump subunit AcrA (membrane-fusion protein)